ncbi:hypothetical protein JHK85_005105 [Glycine max]|nr:hypothetical protein JHK85_005105 [Glycine max]
MRNVLRSLRHLRPAFQRQDCVLISVNVAEEPPCHIGKSCHIHSSAFRVVDHAETNFKNHLFTTTTKPLSNDAAKLTNRETSKAGPLVEYERRIDNGELVEGDACQVDTLTELQRLYDELVESADTCQLDRNSEKPEEYEAFLEYAMEVCYYEDLYSDCLHWLYLIRPSNWRKKRIHFHDFMLNVHSMLQKHKGLSDPLDVVAGEISDDAILLCLDEFMVTDVADALVLNRLFRHLFNKGIILVATSNRAPDNLYEGGLQRDLFLPFIAALKGEQGFYLVGTDLSGFLKQKFQQLIGEGTATPQEVEVVMGRTLHVPLGANGCAYFPFEELCERPVGAADYFGLFRKFHTLALDGIPIFGLHNKSAAHRFVTLVDVMYENKARLLCTAEGSPQDLFEKILTISEAKNMAPRTSSRSRKNDDSNLCVDNELGFAKDRTISRLTEINSKEYLQHHAAMLAEKKERVDQNAVEA